MQPTWREITQEMVWASVTIVVTFKNLFTLGTCFQVFHTISDQKRDKGQERAREKRRQNLSNLSEESLERSTEGKEENVSVKNNVKC